MTKLMGTVTLRNPYRVGLNSNGDYKVTSKSSRGAGYSQEVAATVVDYVYKQCRGRTVTVADAKDLLEHAPKTLRGPFDYGYKLQFYAQDVLLVLVAIGRASYLKCGSRFEYTIFTACNRRHRPRKKLSAVRKRHVR